MTRPIPEAKGHPLFGSARELRRAPHSFPSDLAWQHGGIARFRVLHRQIVVIADPELAQEVLVSRWQRYVRGRPSRNIGLISNGLLALSGQEWLERRRLAQPAFNREMLNGVVSTTRACVTVLLAAWERAGDGAVALEPGMLRLSMSTIARMLLSADVSEVSAERTAALLRRGLALIAKRNTMIWPAPPWLPTPTNRGFRAVRRELDRFIVSHLATRASEASATTDLHAALRAARDPRTGKAFTAEALLEETKTLFFAGYETTATSLTWTLYLLARHPGVAEALFEEFQRVLGGRDLVMADLSALPYARAVLQEAMRLYPPVYTLPRRTAAEDELGGYLIPAGTPVLISILGVHRAPAWGADVAAFRPDRFLDPGWPRRAYLPFGAGRHLCIGSDVAHVESLVALSIILRRYRLATPSEVGVRPRITMVPDGEIRLQLEPR